jgi:methylenetetrahydrofolate dehydrogenase (NADP+) / methenyltetrahydrofolate cyclohydrolase
MMGKIINGTALSQEQRNLIKTFIDDRVEKSLRVPCLASILVGDDEGSEYYLKTQNKLCEKLGLKTKNYKFDSNVKEDEIIKCIEKLNNDKTVDGILLMLPLPEGLNDKMVASKICFQKDVDGITDINNGRFYRGEESFAPCTSLAVMETIKSTDIDIEGKNVVVCGRSNVVGKPTAQLLLDANATVTICHSMTENMKEICKSADIIVSAMEKPNYLTKDFVKEGAIVIDVGTTIIDGNVHGDVDFESVMEIASFVSPVPGGVGTLTTTMLLKNTCEALKSVH